MYIMFPIGWMWYFGTNLDERFAVPDFWPKPEQTYRIPYEKDEIHGEVERLKKQRLLRRQARLREEGFSDEEINADLSTMKLVGKSAGGPLDNSAAAAADTVKSWIGLGKRRA